MTIWVFGNFLGDFVKDFYSFYNEVVVVLVEVIQAMEFLGCQFFFELVGVFIFRIPTIVFDEYFTRVCEVFEGFFGRLVIGF